MSSVGAQHVAPPTSLRSLPPAGRPNRRPDPSACVWCFGYVVHLTVRGSPSMSPILCSPRSPNAGPLPLTSSFAVESDVIPRRFAAEGYPVPQFRDGEFAFPPKSEISNLKCRVPVGALPFAVKSDVIPSRTLPRGAQRTILPSPLNLTSSRGGSQPRDIPSRSFGTGNSPFL
jgi:hypothetical protein